MLKEKELIDCDEQGDCRDCPSSAKCFPIEDTVITAEQLLFNQLAQEEMDNIVE